MDTRNIITHKQSTRLDRAIITLQVLCQELSLPIIEYLQDHDQASLLDLALSTGLDSYVLEEQLEKLCLTRAVVRREDIYGCYYYLDPFRLRRISTIASQLASFLRE